MLRRILFSLTVLAVASAPSSHARPVGSLSYEHVPGRLIVHYEPHAQLAMVREVVERRGFRFLDKDLFDERVRVVQVPRGVELHEAIVALSALPEVRSVGPDFVVRATDCGVVSPDDPFWNDQVNFRVVGADRAWGCARGEGVIVAVIDTGVSPDLPDWGPDRFVAGLDLVNGDDDPTDDNGHGSHVASTIAEATDNGLGVAGLAYRAKIMPIKMLDARGSGNTSDIIAAVNFARQNGAHVINMSLGGGGYDQAAADAIMAARNAGVLVVCATGNEGQNRVSYPGAYPGSIGVGSVTKDGQDLSFFSNYGPETDMVAPGEQVLQQTLSGYESFTGTSMATPHVAGAVAIAYSLEPSSTGTAATATRSKERADAIEAALFDSATDMGATGRDDRFGHGLLDIPALLASLSNGDPGPAPDPDPDPDPGPDPDPSPDPGAPPSWCEPLYPDYVYRPAADTPAPMRPGGEAELAMDAFPSTFPFEMSFAIEIEHPAPGTVGSYDEFFDFVPGLLTVDSYWEGLYMGTLFLDARSAVHQGGIRGCWDVSSEDFPFLFGEGSYVVYAEGEGAGSIVHFSATLY